MKTKKEIKKIQKEIATLQNLDNEHLLNKDGKELLARLKKLDDINDLYLMSKQELVDQLLESKNWEEIFIEYARIGLEKQNKEHLIELLKERI